MVVLSYFLRELNKEEIITIHVHYRYVYKYIVSEG